MSLNRIPGDKKIYIGSLFTLQRKEFLKKQGITHILSAYRPSVEPRISFLQPPPDDDDGEGSPGPQFKRMLIEIEDSGSENIIKHFPRCNAFIQDGLDAGGAVLVHCVMGRSRSAAFIIAYLLSSDDSLDVSSAQALVTQSRPCVQPNAGFMLQLGLYFSMGCPVELDKEAGYYRWLERRGGRKKSGSWEDIRGEIRARARKRRDEEEQQQLLLKGSDDMQQPGVQMGDLKEGDLKHDLNERDVEQGDDLKEEDLPDTTSNSSKTDIRLTQPQTL